MGIRIRNSEVEGSLLLLGSKKSKKRLLPEKTADTMGLKNYLWLTLVVGTAICGMWLVIAVEEEIHSLDELGEWEEFDYEEKFEAEDPSLRVRRAIAPAQAGKAGSGFNHDSCFNVSRWGKVEYKDEACKKCDVHFEKECTNESETICDDIPGLICELIPYTECRMTMREVEYNESVIVRKKKNIWTCEDSIKPVKHTKLVPKCWNETRRNCLTEWRENPDGTEVWDPQGGPCEEVTWKRCELVPKEVDFNQPIVKCTKDSEVYYNDCVPQVKTRMVTGMKCEPKHTVSCKAINNQGCVQVNYMNCEDKPKYNCTDAENRVPFQKFLHRKKCLLPDPNDPHFAEDQARAALAAAQASQGRAGRADLPQQLSANSDSDGNHEENVEKWRQELGFA